VLLARAVVFGVGGLAGILAFIGLAPTNPTAAVVAFLTCVAIGTGISVYLPE
jgi:hypothetical protein